MIEDNNVEPIVSNETKGVSGNNSESNLPQKRPLILISVLPALVVLVIVVIVWTLSRGETGNTNGEVMPRLGNSTSTTLPPTPVVSESDPTVTTVETATPTSPNSSPTVSAVRREYILNGLTLSGQSYPQFNLEFLLDPAYKVELTGEDNNQLNITNGSFSLEIKSLPEGSYGGQYEEVPENTAIASMMDADSLLYRIKSGVSQYPDYHYSNGFELVSQGGCQSYINSGVNIKACDRGQLKIQVGDKAGNLTIGCDVTVEEDVLLCDQIISSLKVTVL
jgi:hypothetical protein